jgi:hypothetical protein
MHPGSVALLEDSAMPGDGAVEHRVFGRAARSAS